MYALNKVALCKVEPQDIKVAPTVVTLYQRSYALQVQAVLCSMKHMRLKWHCGKHDHSSMDYLQNTITSDVELTKDQCHEAFEAGKLPYLSHSIVFKNNTKSIQTFNSGQSKYRNECDGKGWVTHDTVETYVQTIELNVDVEKQHVRTPAGFVLPCKLSEGGCATTSLDANAYFRNIPENCVLSKIKEVPSRMIKNEDKYFILSSTSKYSQDKDFLIQIFDDPQKVCGKPDSVYPTNFDSLFVR